MDSIPKLLLLVEIFNILFILLKSQSHPETFLPAQPHWHPPSMVLVVVCTDSKANVFFFFTPPSIKWTRLTLTPTHTQLQHPTIDGAHGQTLTAMQHNAYFHSTSPHTTERLSLPRELSIWSLWPEQLNQTRRPRRRRPRSPGLLTLDGTTKASWHLMMHWPHTLSLENAPPSAAEELKNGVLSDCRVLVTIIPPQWHTSLLSMASFYKSSFPSVTLLYLVTLYFYCHLQMNCVPFIVVLIGMYSHLYSRETSTKLSLLCLCQGCLSNSYLMRTLMLKCPYYGNQNPRCVVVTLTESYRNICQQSDTTWSRLNTVVAVAVSHVQRTNPNKNWQTTVASSGSPICCHSNRLSPSMFTCRFALTQFPPLQSQAKANACEIYLKISEHKVWDAVQVWSSSSVWPTVILQYGLPSALRALEAACRTDQNSVWATKLQRRTRWSFVTISSNDNVIL